MARISTRRQVATAPPSQAISAYTRVSKSQVLSDAKTVKQSAVATTKEQTSSATVTRKRKKAAAHDDLENDLPRLAKRTVSLAPSSDEEPRTPAKKRSRRAESPVQPLTPAQTPQNKESKARKSTPNATGSAKKTPTKLKDTHQSKLEAYHYTSRKADNGADLIRLHKAFLKTILLHIAHSGRNAPIDIAAIAPNIARNWGKRAVTVEDIRRCVAIENAAEDEAKVSPFFIADYGRGKVCVELKQEWVRDNTTMYEERLCRQFEENIRQICVERARDETCDMEMPLEDVSLSDLPQADIINKDGGMQANPLLAKGHRALSELKNDLAEKQQDKAARKHAAADVMVNANGSKMSLLDRIRHKKLAKANEPLAPSGPELERRAALNRVIDVAATIFVFSLSNPSSTPRQAFTMTLILDKLRDSLLVPISSEEGAACVRLIAKEIAPEWVKVVMVGGRENVVIQTNAQPVDRILSDRVQKLLGSC